MTLWIEELATQVSGPEFDTQNLVKNPDAEAYL